MKSLMKRNAKLLWILLIFAKWFFPWGLLLGETTEKPHAKAQLMLSHSALIPGKSFTAAIRLEIERGWHLYWVNPGDSGLATSIRWHLPDGFTPGEIEWPYPVRFQSGESVNFGYKKEVTLLVEIDTPSQIGEGSTLPIQAEVQWLACKDLCVPGKARVQQELRFQTKASTPSPRYKTLERARNLMPKRLGDWDVQARLKGSTLELSLQAANPQRIKSIQTFEFFPLDEGLLDLSKAPSISRLNDQLNMVLPRNLKSSTSPKTLRGVLVSPKGWDPKGHVRAMWVDVELRT